MYVFIIETDRLRFTKLDLNNANANPTSEDLERRRQLKLSFQAENIAPRIIKAPPIPDRTRYVNDIYLYSN